MMNKIKLAISIIALTTSLHAMSFEDSPAFEKSSAHFKSTYDILTSLPPVEIVIPQGTYAFNGWYIVTLEEYFHNVVTPILQVQIGYNLNITNDIEVVTNLLKDLIKERNKLMVDGFKKAHEIALKMKIKYAMDDEMTDDSSYTGCLMTMNHYKIKTLSESCNLSNNVYTTVNAVAVEVLENN